MIKKPLVCALTVIVTRNWKDYEYGCDYVVTNSIYNFRMLAYWNVVLTHFSPVSHFYTP